ncbi:MAG: CocE/NonD family hydrolase [Nannocystaceae bacterium]
MHDTPLPRRPFLGLELQNPLKSMDPARGLEVLRVVKGATADQAGVHTGDRLLAIAGSRLSHASDLALAVTGLTSAHSVEFEVARQASTHRLRAEVQSMPLEDIRGANIELGQVVADGKRLRTFVTRPKNAGNHPLPVVLLLPGMSCHSREFPFSPAHPQTRLIEQWTAAGLATLRVERRGVGDSDGPASEDTDLSAEVAGFRAGLRYLLAANWVDHKCIYIFGQSLGGILAPLVARGLPVRGIAVYGACANRWSDSVLGSARRHGELAGAHAPTFERALAALAELLRGILDHGHAPADLLASHPAYRVVARAAGIKGNRMHGRCPDLFRQLEGIDLPAAWAELEAEVLAMHGSRDRTTTAEDASKIATSAGGTSLELDGLDHNWQAEDFDGVARLGAATLRMYLHHGQEKSSSEPSPPIA